MAKQTARGKAQDKRKTARNTLPDTKKNIAIWEKNPSRMDIKGKDTKEGEVSPKSKQVNPITAQRLISNALAKGIKTKGLKYRQKLYAKMKETYANAIKYGVDTRKTSYMKQGIIINGLEYSMKYYRDNKLIS